MAVFTKVDLETLQKFLKSYSVGELLSYEGITEGNENSNYLIKTTKGKFILTLYEKRVKAKDLPFFIGVMQYLSRNGIVCPTPIKMRSGDILSKIKNKYAALTSFIEGSCPKTITAQHCLELGRTMSRIHKTGNNFCKKRINSLSIENMKELIDQISIKGPVISQELKNELTEEIKYLQQNWPKNLPTGLVHADLFPDNVLFIKYRCTGIIDFYFSCNDILAYDIAICINSWCFNNNNKSIDKTKITSIIKGYEENRKLTTCEKQSLQLLCRGSSMRFLLTRLYDTLDTSKPREITLKDPDEFLYKLRYNQKLNSYSDYGLK